MWSPTPLDFVGRLVGSVLGEWLGGARSTMAKKGFSYSKWDNIELSDDEDNFHPNIDNNLMIRLQREKREQREKEEADQRAKLEKEGTQRQEPLLRQFHLFSLGKTTLAGVAVRLSQ